MALKVKWTKKGPSSIALYELLAFRIEYMVSYKPINLDMFKIQSYGDPTPYTHNNTKQSECMMCWQLAGQ